MRTKDTHLTTRALRVRTLAETLAIVAAFALTAGSAVIAKRYGQAGPALVAVDGGGRSASDDPDAGRAVQGRAIQNSSREDRGSAAAGGPADQAAATAVREAVPVAGAADRGARAAAADAKVSTPPTRVITPPAGYERYFNGRPLRKVKTMTMSVTAYSPDHRSCGASADGITSSMKSVWTNGMRLVAADPKVLRKGSLLIVPGYAGGEVVPVLDTGGAIKGMRLDVLYPSHDQARKWGRKKLKVEVWEYAD